MTDAASSSRSTLSTLRGTWTRSGTSSASSAGWCNAFSASGARTDRLRASRLGDVFLRRKRVVPLSDDTGSLSRLSTVPAPVFGLRAAFQGTQQKCRVQGDQVVEQHVGPEGDQDHHHELLQ